MQTSSHLLASSEEILSSLISFKSTPGTDGHGIIDWVSGYLKQYGLQVFRFPFPQSRADSTDAPANLFTTIGPQRDGGLCLSSHLDVVPASKENWTHPPFQLTSETLQKVNKADDSAAVRRLFGRGTTDMKGFAALVLALVPQWIRQHRSQPIHLAFT